MRMCLIGCLLVTLAGLQSSVSASDSMDWPHWRGPEMNGISRERDLPDSWNPEGGEGSNLVWKKPELATRSTPIVMDGKLYVLVRDQPGTPKEGEKVVCVNSLTGEKIWEYRFNVFLTDVPDTRTCWSCVTGDPDTGNVFAQCVCGTFVCLNGKTGKEIWRHDLSEEYGLLTTYGGRTNIPTVFENTVIISGIVIGWGDYAKPAHRFIAFDKYNGQAIWYNQTRLLPYDTTYSSPFLGVINGEAQFIFGSGDGAIHGFQPRTGKPIWKYNVSRRGINNNPVLVDNIVVCGHNEENLDSTEMGAIFAIDATKTGDITKTGELWRNKNFFASRSSPLIVDKTLFGFEDRGTLLALDLKTGKTKYKTKVGRAMFGSAVYGDGKLYICESNGYWWILKPGEKKFETVHKMRLDNHQINGSPVISHGKIYLPTSEGMYCIGKPDNKPIADARPETPPESDVSEDETAAWLQLAPVESILRPTSPQKNGQKQRFQVRLYNKKGQFLRMAKPDEIEFSLNGPGEINKGTFDTSQGEYKAPGIDGAHKSVIVTAKVGELKGDARIRLVPPLDWSFNFDDGIIPDTWVGVQYRHVIIDYKLFESLTKENPQAGQMYLYIMTNFTNFNPKVAVFDDSTPRETWTKFLRFLKLDNGEKRPKNIKEAETALKESFELLKGKGVISSWEFSEWNKKLDNGEEIGGPKLTLNRGDHKISDGNGVMVKITTIPKGTRSQGYMGQTEYNNYTIQADVLGAVKDGRLPEIGLVAQRYALKIMGDKQEILIHTWYSHDKHMTKTAPLKWNPNTWYTMKFSASTTPDGKALLKGKVWPQGEKEPEKWLLEVEDESGNLQGSPGFFGNASVSEIFYDNVTVKMTK